MRPAGRKAFEARDEARTAIYAYEQRPVKLEKSYEQKLRANPKAWDHFRSRPPWYRRTSTYWVMSAKKEETRLKRLERLIDDSAQGRSIQPLTRPT